MGIGILGYDVSFAKIVALMYYQYKKDDFYWQSLRYGEAVHKTCLNI